MQLCMSALGACREDAGLQPHEPPVEPVDAGNCA